jgi:enamine deaminase RidA (YjgF/YER057c/UK114 family)
VVDGDWIFVAGTTGFDYQMMTIPDSLDDQVKQTIANVRMYLARVDANLADVVQCNWVITERAHFVDCAKLLAMAFRPNRPAMMTLVCNLIDERMKFEMQVIARR